MNYQRNTVGLGREFLYYATMLLIQPLGVMNFCLLGCSSKVEGCIMEKAMCCNGSGYHTLIDDVSSSCVDLHRVSTMCGEA